MNLQLSTGNGRGRSTTLSAERLVNLYAEKAPAGAESNVALLGCPGLITFATVGTGPCRGMCEVAGKMYVVSGLSLYSIDSAGTASSILGTVAGTGIVSMANDGDIIVIVTGAAGYTYTVSTLAFAAIVDAAYDVTAHSVVWMSQRFIFATPLLHFIGAAGGLLPFNALMAASAEYSPDDIVGLAVDHNEVLIFGSATLESWVSVQVTDATAYPYDLIAGAVGQRGLCSRNAIAQSDNSTFWVDDQLIARRLSAGYAPSRISTEAVEHQLTLATRSTIEAFVYFVEGHEFLVLNTDVGTHVYDSSTLLWHERRSYDIARWKAQRSVYCYNAWYVGHYNTGVISKISTSVNVENSTTMVASMIFPPVVFGRDRFTTNELELGCDGGVGTLTENPIVTMFVSDDSETWSNGFTSRLGLQGSRRNRVIWRRLGQRDKAIFRFDISDAYKRAVYAGYADITQDDR